MSETMGRCGDCRHWDEGVCRRYPPMPVEMETLRESVHVGDVPIAPLIRERRVMNWWPDTAEDEWCGEWSGT